MLTAEGVTKFSADHQRRPLPRRYNELAFTLIGWRSMMVQLGLLGQDRTRYGGAGFGNISGRVMPLGTPQGRRAMLISGSQTGGRQTMSRDDFCLVARYDEQRNWVKSYGQLRPSSETLTHGAIYDLSPAIRFVLHAHSALLWQQARQLGIPISDARAGYGTCDMAREVRRMYRSSTLSATHILAMGGHQDGIIVFGETAERTGQVLLGYLARAYIARAKRRP